MTLLVRNLARRVPPAAFSFVMATGIISTALNLTGWTVLSAVFLITALGGLVVLAGLSLTRLALYRRDVLADMQNPGRAFGFFTIVAGLDVVAVRLAAGGYPWPAAVLAGMSVPVWLILTYSIPAGFFLRPGNKPEPVRIDGSWLLWVVGTQALAIVTSLAAAASASDFLAGVAVGLWGIGVMLYLILTVLIVHQLVTVRSDPASFSPTYWIVMGATAISVLGAAHILDLPHTLPIVSATAATVTGTGYFLWAVGTWWIPFLVIFGLWRHLIRHVPLRYTTALWSIVFPIGMYSTASITFGTTLGAAFMVDVGRIGTAVAVLTWVGVLLLAAYTAFHPLRQDKDHGSPTGDTRC
ncbi:tellurite resistance/C4-dicarboxylate transporter family protein [Subtercola sp. RTI3]|uniref:tellurite resistance/C4-dicarboxylate transporter family protein n=1 Tax=Subtercola sp. RTI3 TaxID=3048639 RepID=UPI002B2391A7|nr:tellurite resistance/C4-dicarboxylate transporter family protein [Subtercola sp. RTI3]MEA9985961.1 tellurite resistance/C4-dicarboxylate transporter family protein [Subtercola sp. RTI3]